MLPVTAAVTVAGSFSLRVTLTSMSLSTGMNASDVAAPLKSLPALAALRGREVHASEEKRGPRCGRE